jgi:hypothetical protein
LTIEEEMEKYRKVNDHQVRQVLDRYPMKQISVEALGPLKTFKRDE